MSRPIKFRAYDEPAQDFRYITLLPRRVFEYENDGVGPLGHRSVNLAVWEQFTGLHDKSGMEIYEGDIVRRAQPLPQQTGLKHVDYIPQGPVVYDAPNYYFDDTEMGYQQLALGVTESSPSFEVIGNIHENPELVK